MMTNRTGEAGVTLIEMLAALSVSAMIGVAGFALLESVVQTEAGVAGRLDALSKRDRAFQVLALDLSKAQDFEVRAAGQVSLTYLTHQIEWRGDMDGLERRIIRKDRAAFVQTLLKTATQLTVSEAPAALLTLRLPEEDLWRIFPLPERAVP